MPVALRRYSEPAGFQPAYFPHLRLAAHRENPKTVQIIVVVWRIMRVTRDFRYFVSVTAAKYFRRAWRSAAAYFSSAVSGSGAQSDCLAVERLRRRPAPLLIHRPDDRPAFPIHQEDSAFQSASRVRHVSAAVSAVVFFALRLRRRIQFRRFSARTPRPTGPLKSRPPVSGSVTTRYMPARETIGQILVQPAGHRKHVHRCACRARLAPNAKLAKQYVRQ